MSILIESMEMPKSCRACHLKMNCDDCEGWECFCVPLGQKIGYFGDLLTDKRRNDCPLVPVPPHGRLIDADALSAKLNTMLSMAFGEGNTAFHFAYRSLGKMVENAPTIIPAEPGEEDE